MGALTGYAGEDDEAVKEKASLRCFGEEESKEDLKAADAMEGKREDIEEESVDESEVKQEVVEQLEEAGEARAE